MGRFWLGIGILLLSLLLGFWIGDYMDQIHLTIADTLDRAAEQAMAGDMEAAQVTAQKGKSEWKKHWHFSAVVADHAPMDEIDGLLAQLEYYNRSGQKGDFAACCARISLLVQAMSEAHSLKWWNLL